MDDIQQRHVLLAVLAAATVHAVVMTVYLAMLHPVRPPPQRPPLILLQSPPPPPAALPEKPQEPSALQPTTPAKPIEAPAYDPALPSVTLRKAEETPVMEEFETIITPLPEPAPPPKPEPVPAPKPLDLTQFEIPQIEAVPVPRPKPAPPRTRTSATAPVPGAAPRSAANTGEATTRAATASASSGGTGKSTSGVPWPRSVELLSPDQKQQLLTEYYVEDKSHWQDWYETRDDAWRHLDQGFVDPTAPPDEIDLQDPSNAHLRPPNWDPNEGPLTVQELEETLKKLVAAGTKALLGRDVASVKDLRYSERQKLLKKHYAKDPRWAIGVVDPKAGPDQIDLADPAYAADRPLNWDPNEGPLTVQELEATLEKLVQLGTQPFIGRKVHSVRELTYGERQDILHRYYKDDPRWQIGVVDPKVPPDKIDLADPGYAAERPANYDRFEAPLTIQEVDKTLHEMLDKKLRAQDGHGLDDPPPH
jgi:hypothetical protein